MADEQKVELDKTREVFEQEIAKLHQQIYRDTGRFQELNHLVLDVVEKQRAEAPVRTSAIQSSPFLSQMGLESNIEIEDRLVFVLTPFSQDEQQTYEHIRQTCNNLGLSVRRGDEKQILGAILPHILSEIARSWLVIANLNGRNPNVFYELGIAQTLGKPCLLVGKSEEALPFDLSHQQVVLYSDLNELRPRLTEAISRVALGKGNAGPMRTYVPQPVKQEMIIQLVQPHEWRVAMDALRSHEDITSVHPVVDTGTLIIKGMSKSRQFITDVGDFLRSRGIQTSSAQLLSGTAELDAARGGA